MNLRIISSFLGIVAALIGLAMFACIPSGWPCFGGTEFDGRGMSALAEGGVLSFACALVFFLHGRHADAQRLFLREAFACVSLSWILAVLLGSTPFLFADLERGDGCPVGFCDAIFESASGFTTTGATIFSDVENPETLPRSILFWRGTTHFMGGLGVMCCFVAFLGHGARGKAVMKVEHFSSGTLPYTRMRMLAFSLFLIYIILNVGAFLWFLACGAGVYDSLSHAFSVVALGGFSTHNASVGYFSTADGVHSDTLEVGMIFFMLVSGTNFWLLYWAALGKPGKLVRDFEWRAFVVSIFLASLFTAIFGIYKGDFRLPRNVEAMEVAVADDADEIQFDEIELLESGEPGTRCNSFADAFRKSLFHSASLATGAGFATDAYDSWNATSICLFLILMFMGGCSGSTAGGAKVYRVALAAKFLAREAERKYRPTVIRTTKIYGEDIPKETAAVAIRYIVVLASLIAATTLLVATIEPDAAWAEFERPQIEKLFDLGAGSLAMFGNVGLAFGELGSLPNYGGLTGATKIIFSWAMIVGRLEIWPVLALFSLRYWRNR